MSGRESLDGSDTLHVAHSNGSRPASPTTATATVPPAIVADDAPKGPPKAVEDVMYSDIGINTLLNRLKQSIASARDFADFLRKRSRLEEEQAKGLKALAKSQLDAAKRPDSKSGSYALQLGEVLRVHERMGDNGMQFALSLHQMHEDLNTLTAEIERGRKQQKHEGLDAEKKAFDAEQAMQKAKARYDTLAESYDRARTGDTKGSRRLGLKGPKSAEQVESEMLHKVQAADSEYEERVKGAKSQRDHLLRIGRPQAVKALQSLIKECDQALALQLQKYATFNEKLLLGNGLAVSPLTDGDAPSAQKSLRELVVEIDNEKDFNNYIASHSGKVPPTPSEIKYEKHPTLAPKQQVPKSQTPSVAPPAPAPAPAPAPSGGLGINSMTSQSTSANSRYSSMPSSMVTAAPSYHSQAPASAGGYGYSQSPGGPGDTFSYDQKQGSYGSQTSTLRDGPSNPPYPVHPSERITSPVSPVSGYSPSQTTGSIAAAANPVTMSPLGTSNFPVPPTKSSRTPPRPVFGVSLEELFSRDQSAVPMVVYQCMQAVDLFGLEVEGIYRMSGTASHVNTLRDAFNHNAPNLDFRNPANFHHDVNSVATLLKQFFRDLPDPLFTSSGYDGFINAARVEDPSARRDALHQQINDLPDPNYATLRALILHLHRVTQSESRNRMGSSNLAICFAPSLMGAHTGSQIADSGLQTKVVDTILMNATAIFDED
ncbi:RHO GTPase-activating protein RGD1-like [Venturia nashicola]|nr:RHO GTPase-activating protein RGD1-like [Venturia nashicola]